MKCVILQPSYMPWRGFFHQIWKSDVFVFLDDVQYDKHGWRNRNRIKGPGGSQWLTIPVSKRGVVSESIPIKDVEICWDRPWSDKHRESIRQAYARAPYLDAYYPTLAEFYTRRDERLADFTIDLTVALAKLLGVGDRSFVRSSSLGAGGSKTDRLVEILTAVGATHYISGPSARAYIEEEKLAAAGITLEFMEYDYPEYPQLHPPFDPRVSVVDLLFMVGDDAAGYIWGS
jgi:hypothetical protein